MCPVKNKPFVHKSGKNTTAYLLQQPLDLDRSSCAADETWSSLWREDFLQVCRRDVKLSAENTPGIILRSQPMCSLQLDSKIKWRWQRLPILQVLSVIVSLKGVGLVVASWVPWSPHFVVHKQICEKLKTQAGVEY